MNNELLIAILVSGFGLLNVLVTVFLTPRLSDKFSQKSYERDKLYVYTIELLDYITRAESFQDLAGVPSQVRVDCLRIHMLFNDGEAPKEISDLMEKIFKVFYVRRGEGQPLSSADQDVIRRAVKDLRKELSFYLKNGVTAQKELQNNNNC